MIELRPFEKDDCERLMTWVDNSPEFLLQWAGLLFTWPLTMEQLEEYWESAQREDTDRLIFKAVNERGDVVGHIELNGISRVHRCARVSRVLVAPAWRGMGIGYKMIRALLRVAFEELKLHRLDLVVFEFNKPAIACYEKAGFVKEGVLRECRRLGDRYLNQVMMSMLEHEYWATVGTS